MLISQPLPSIPSQLAKPAWQPTSLQIPALHAASPLGKEQTRPQAPQLLRSLLMFVSQPSPALLLQSAYGARQV